MEVTPKSALQFQVQNEIGIEIFFEAMECFMRRLNIFLKDSERSSLCGPFVENLSDEILCDHIYNTLTMTRLHFVFEMILNVK